MSRENWPVSDDFSREYVHVIRGACFGIGLSRRGVNDPHILFTILHEDDEHWWDDHNGPTTFSSAWHYDLPAAIKEAVEWCEANADPDIPENIGAQLGWKFREG